LRAIGFGLLPNESRDLVARVPPDAPEGRYRLSTSVNSDLVAEARWLSDEFNIAGGFSAGETRSRGHASS
jgi:hypothetical protein